MFDYDFVSEEHECPKCGGASKFIGALGMLTYWRCIACGWDWHVNACDSEEVFNGE